MKVVIIGGGFAGLTTAKVLGNQPNIDVTLIDKTNHHLFQPLLYQVAMAGLAPSDIAAPLRSLVSSFKNIKVLMNEVINIDLNHKKVFLKDNQEITYDKLILSPGVENNYHQHPQWENLTFGLKNLEDAIKIRNHLLNCFEQAEQEKDKTVQTSLLRFVIIGGGPTGVELAGSIAELCKYTLNQDFKNITPANAGVILIERGKRILSVFKENLSLKAREQMEDLGVQISYGQGVKDISKDGVTLEDGTFFASKTVIWAAGVKATSLLNTIPGDKDHLGRIIVNKNCSHPNYAEVFILGDAACFKTPTGNLPGLSPVAIQQGEFVAKNLIREMKKVSLNKTFTYLDKGSMATIGRKRAVADLNFFTLWGSPAWLAWLLVHLIFLIGFRNKIIVLINWIWAYFTYKRGARLISKK